MANPDESVTPLLAMGAVLRSGDVTFPGRYCRKRHVWIVETALGDVPAVVAANGHAELMTKTAVRQERDDQSPRTPEDFDQFLELVTKTETRRERDDR
jgi:hypothetical protein